MWVLLTITQQMFTADFFHQIKNKIEYKQESANATLRISFFLLSSDSVVKVCWRGIVTTGIVLTNLLWHWKDLITSHQPVVCSKKEKSHQQQSALQTLSWLQFLTKRISRRLCSAGRKYLIIWFLGKEKDNIVTLFYFIFPTFCRLGILKAKICFYT